ncbi:hypothetical protein Taro_016481, partial [Colocasia esculenta]|nr:hypothetical protein [Colocasia esculenta]
MLHLSRVSGDGVSPVEFGSEVGYLHLQLGLDRRWDHFPPKLSTLLFPSPFAKPRNPRRAEALHSHRLLPRSPVPAPCIAIVSDLRIVVPTPGIEASTTSAPCIASRHASPPHAAHRSLSVCSNLSSSWPAGTTFSTHTLISATFFLSVPLFHPASPNVGGWPSGWSPMAEKGFPHNQASRRGLKQQRQGGEEDGAGGHSLRSCAGGADEGTGKAVASGSWTAQTGRWEVVHRLRHRERICILGGGFGGLYTALRLESLVWTDDKKPQNLVLHGIILAQ